MNVYNEEDGIKVTAKFTPLLLLLEPGKRKRRANAKAFTISKIIHMKISS
jgi:hypothetical protein